MSCLRRTITSTVDESNLIVWMRFIWDLQNGCSETNIVRRMMELPLKLMTLLTVTISKSSTTSLGPLIGRDRTSVALTLLVCWKLNKPGEECEEYNAENAWVGQLKHDDGNPRPYNLKLADTSMES